MKTALLQGLKSHDDHMVWNIFVINVKFNFIIMIRDMIINCIMSLIKLYSIILAY